MPHQHAGAFAACLVGWIHMASSLLYGTTLIAFYLSGSKLTRIGSKKKALLEEDHKPGGQRHVVQVLSNSLWPCIAILIQAAALQGWIAGGDKLHIACTAAVLPGATLEYHLAEFQFAAIDPDAAAISEFVLHRFQQAHYACCCADTWASELGILSTTQPWLVTAPWRVVPPGTNGGVTFLGFLASIAGSACIATTWLVVNQIARYANVLGIAQTLETRQVLIIAFAAGLGGSLLDSFLGATVQYSGWHRGLKKVVGKPGPDVQHLVGINVLTNDGVNASAAALVSLTAALAAWHELL